MKRNKILSYGLTLLTASSALATPPVPATLAPPDYRPWTVGLESGTMGYIGGSVAWRFADHFGARVGVDWGQFSDGQKTIKSITYDSRLQLLSEPLTLDLYPWKTHSFHVSVGALFNQNELTGTANRSDTLIMDRGGVLSMKVQQQPVNPYLSIGGNFFYFDHAHHWAMGGELGVTYTGEPKSSLNWTGGGRGSDAVLQRAQNSLQDYASRFKWWPVLKLNVSYSF